MKLEYTQQDLEEAVEAAELRGKGSIDVPTAMSVILKALREDEAYRESWKANIAMAFKDATCRHYKEEIEEDDSGFDHDTLHHIANQAADNFLNQLTYEPSPEK